MVSRRFRCSELSPRCFPRFHASLSHALEVADKNSHSLELRHCLVVRRVFPNDRPDCKSGGNDSVGAHSRHWASIPSVRSLFPDCLGLGSRSVPGEVAWRTWSSTSSTALFGRRNSNRRYGRHHHESSRTASDRGLPV